MASSAALLLCLLAMCSVWTVRGRSLEIGSDEEEQVNMKLVRTARKVNAPCKSCEESLKKVKELAGPKPTRERLQSILDTICEEMGTFKPGCNKYVQPKLKELIKELMTNDYGRTTCVKIGACKAK